ncbi:MAG: family 10 glycosylhydrolase [Prevotella sp.]|nr:family 10 glycosylhydrolase [Prevotella sp.]
MMKKTVLLLLLMMTLLVSAQQKREFRGAWIQCVNGQFQGMGTQKMQQTLAYQLDELQKDGVNAIIFQVRPECDALYESSIEPWSRFLTGQQGKAPSPYWDPLQWMIDQCHARGMELHAWINPYRAKTKTTNLLATTHVAVRHPEWCFDYDGLKILNPGIPENRDYICQVARDIVTRYDIDGIHMDDYFYPYPAAGQQIPDDAQYRQYSNGIKDRGDWRRYNVNLFIKQFYETVHQAKPWVKVGISPFGIYRNKKSAAIGSNTNGLQNYDDLYADVLLWVNNGWLDYCVPQIYWEIGNRAADYDTLIRWWSQHAAGRPLFIGEDIERTVKFGQQAQKRTLSQQMPGVQGTVLWYAKAAVDNTGNYGTVLRQNYWRHPALQPQMPFIDKKAPKAPRKVKPVWTSDGYILFWTAPKGKNWDDVATRYVVYRFEKGEKVNTDDPAKIVAVTPNTYYKLPYANGHQKYTYVVTALDRLQNESKPAKKTVKL